ncbi:hypothetical protein [Enterocloster lavalensis]|uniref:hypothetical protein n=1 Tax=Enterocloster lavalensis TaxID=460384 RepID=UPI0023F367AA|nr:hypothetical protein [Enterocloster lavalensis]
MDRGAMTEISGNNLGFLMGDERSPRQMVEFLKEGARLRSFGDVLRQVYPHEDLAARLTGGLEEITGDSRDSLAKKVRNWLKGQNMPQNREALFQISFALGLDETGASRLLGAAAETGIHYRNPEELAYAFALRTGASYEKALELKDMAHAVCDGRMGGGKEKARGEMPSIYTRQLRDAFGQVQTEEELEAFFREHAGELGRLHETAYEKFHELLDLLQKPVGERDRRVQEKLDREDEEREYSMRDVIVEYLGMNVPEARNLAGMTPLQRLVKRFWPNESSLFNMRNRKEDVSRKVMILLYLITEAFDEETEDEEENYPDDLEDEDADTRLEIRFEKMNLFLNTYGMNLLDPGNAFDLLVLYSMKAQESGERMAEVLDALFMGQGRRKKVEESETGRGYDKGDA